MLLIFTRLNCILKGQYSKKNGSLDYVFIVLGPAKPLTCYIGNKYIQNFDFEGITLNME